MSHDLFDRSCDVTRMAFVKTFLCLIFACLCSASDEFSETAKQSQGQPWPMPQSFQQTADILILDEKNFKFSFKTHSCDLLDGAVERYHGIIFDHRNEVMLWYREASLLSGLVLDLKSPCEYYPHFGMDESCKLNVRVIFRPRG